MNGHAASSDTSIAARRANRPQTQRLAIFCALGLLVAGCAENVVSIPARKVMPDRAIRATPPAGRTQARHGDDGWRPTPRIVTGARKLQCVPYARRHTHIDIQGDAWTWWRAAKGRYRRGRKPVAGAVLVFSRNGRSRGHLAVVSKVIGSRVIVANHANWLNQGRVHMDTPIRDVSRNNDWSEVRVWYTPLKQLGRKRYRTHGFIYPNIRTAFRR